MGEKHEEKAKIYVQVWQHGRSLFFVFFLKQFHNKIEQLNLKCLSKGELYNAVQFRVKWCTTVAAPRDSLALVQFPRDSVTGGESFSSSTTKILTKNSSSTWWLCVSRFQPCQFYLFSYSTTQKKKQVAILFCFFKEMRRSIQSRWSAMMTAVKLTTRKKFKSK